MKKYVKPIIEILVFDEIDIVTASGVEQQTNQAAVTKRNDAIVDVNISIPTIKSVN